MITVVTVMSWLWQPCHWRLLCPFVPREHRYSYPPAMRRRAASVQSRPAASATARYQQQQQQLQLLQELKKTENIIYLHLRLNSTASLHFLSRDFQCLEWVSVFASCRLRFGKITKRFFFTGCFFKWRVYKLHFGNYKKLDCFGDKRKGFPLQETV
jgi:hypothetical protein